MEKNPLHRKANSQRKSHSLDTRTNTPQQKWRMAPTVISQQSFGEGFQGPHQACCPKQVEYLEKICLYQDLELEELVANIDQLPKLFSYKNLQLDTRFKDVIMLISIVFLLALFSFCSYCELVDIPSMCMLPIMLLCNLRLQVIALHHHSQ